MRQHRIGKKWFKDARKANKTAAKKSFKLSQHKSNAKKDKLASAKLSHQYYNDIFFASPRIFSFLNKENYRYQDAKYFNKVFKNLLFNSKDTNNNKPIKVGNKIILTNNKIIKVKKSSMRVVYVKNNHYKVWDKTKPYQIITIDKQANILEIEKIKPKNKVYGFENQKKPDYYWAIWYTYKQF